VFTPPVNLLNKFSMIFKEERDSRKLQLFSMVNRKNTSFNLEQFTEYPAFIQSLCLKSIFQKKK